MVSYLGWGGWPHANDPAGLHGSVRLAENARNPVQSRKEKAEELLNRASRYLPLTDGARRRAASLAASGFGPADSLHVAVAIESEVDVFVTTDGDLARKAARFAVPLRVLNPILLAEEITHEAR
jgi:predicted nucleic acid-binding protein